MSPPLLADRMLGKLARILRTIGQDVEYAREGAPAEIAARAASEGRVLLTRDTRLVARGPSVLVRSNYPFHQARQVVRELALPLTPAFTRCVEDNGPLAPVSPEAVAAEVPSYVLASQPAFLRCARCQRVYWAGTHTEGMRQLIAALEGAPLAADDDDEPADPEEGELSALEPLVDLHQALEVQLLEHRVALMRGELAAASRALERFAAWMRRHVEDETALVLPVYARRDSFARGARPEVFAGEHARILELVARAEAQTAELGRAALEGDALRVACLSLLDREKVLADLCEHHDRRERSHLYPALEAALGREAQEALLARMVGFGAP